MVESRMGAVAWGLWPTPRFPSHRVTGGGRPPPVLTERGVRLYRTPRKTRFAGGRLALPRPSSQTADFNALARRNAHRTGRADLRHPACMGLSLSRWRHAILVVLCIPFFCSTRAASILPSRPHISIAVARSGGQGRRFFSAAEGLSLTDASTAAGCRRSGGWPRDDPRGACHWPRSIARTTLVFG